MFLLLIFVSFEQEMQVMKFIHIDVLPLYSNNSTESNHKIFFVLNDSGNVIRDEQSICNAFNIFYINITSSLKNNHLYNYTPVLYLKRINDNVFNFTFIEEEEVNDLINSIKKKSVGSNEIKYSVIIENFLIFCKCLLIFINNMFFNNEFPNCLKDSIVTPFFMSGDHRDLNNYRPVSKISNVSKVFEKAILNQILIFF